MKIINRLLAVTGLAALSFNTVAAAPEVPYWKDVQVVSVNKVPPRSAFMSYDSEAAARTGRYENSSYYRLLNGVWKFHYVDAYGELNGRETDADYDVSSWADIKVPGNWERQGFGTAIYTNIRYEFATYNPQPPVLPEANPVGIYRRDFEVPEQWDGRDIYLHLAGAKSGVYVYVNGREVGYNEDSKNPAEYLINDYLRPGKNVLTLKMFRWSTGSFLECQDFWRISGIERDVFLWSQPKVAVRDFRIKSLLDKTYKNGEFAVAVDLTNHGGGNSEAEIVCELFDAAGNKLVSQSRVADIAAGGEATVSFEQVLSDVKPWSAEHPDLYKVLFTLKEQGRVQEVIPYNVGFRRFEITQIDSKSADGNPYTVLLVNGQPIKFKGVNIHEHDPITGHYVSEELMRRDFELMKRNNFNAVRLCHYTQDRRFYELCDEYGFYVYDEANVESHGMGYSLSKGASLGNNPEWLKPHMERTANMFERNKNYPSVTLWSLGNEAGNGYNFYQTYLYLKQADKDLMNRPVNYERALWEWNTDMYVPQYPGEAWFVHIGSQGSDRPAVPSEYAHAMGNSTGNFIGQWNAIYKYPNMQGGFIWDWVDQGFLEHDDKGRAYWTYGGDYGDDYTPSDANFCCNGLVAPDRTPHPGLAEVKYAQQEIGFEQAAENSGEVRITNRFYFTPIEGQYKIVCRLMHEGRKVREKEIDVRLEPQQSAVYHTFSAADCKGDGEYFVDFSAVARKDMGLIPAGYEVASGQFKLAGAAAPAAFSRKGPALGIDDNGEQVAVKSSRVNFVFDRKLGMVTSYEVAGVEYFNEGFGLQPNFWRGPTDNDYGCSMPRRLQVWKESSHNFNVVGASAERKGEAVELRTSYLLAAGNLYITTYTIWPSGVVEADVVFTSTDMNAVEVPLTEAERTATFSPGKDLARQDASKLDVPRIGVRFRLPVAMQQITYFGRGPGENYQDRKAASHVGLYKTTADDMYYPYIRPQENGHRTETRRVTFATRNGRGLEVVARTLVGFNALHNPVEDFDGEDMTSRRYQWRNLTPEQKLHNVDDARNILARQTHINDIVPHDFVEVCLDMEQRGVGGYDSWGAQPEPEHLIPAARDYQWGFTLIPR